MTIAELIDILEQYPGEAKIDAYGYPITPVSIQYNRRMNQIYVNTPRDITNRPKEVRYLDEIGQIEFRQRPQGDSDAS